MSNITPPSDLVYDWARDRELLNDKTPFPEYIATRAAQWGADQELEACCEWLEQKGFAFVDELRAVRRPKPPSLKQQALEAQQRMWDRGVTRKDWEFVRRALEELPE